MGLVIGSFLNVVIVRLPRMLEREWAAACAELQAETTAGASAAAADAAPPYDLARPRSHCPACGHGLAWYELVPVLSWLWQRGRCRHCRASVSVQYPLVELACAALFAACAWRFGATPAMPAAAALCAALLALAVIDLRTLLLPDAITQPLLWAGLALNLTPHGYASLEAAVIGAMAGYLVLWVIAVGFQKLVGKEGMGQGDLKLLAALGAWFGWPALPGIILYASVAGAAVGLALLGLRRLRRDQPLPFGPFLAGAGLLALFLPAWLRLS
nr:A24 family peptidase [Verticiella sediminum]